MFHPDTGEDGDHTVLNKIRNMGIFGGNETPRICFDYDIHTGDMILFKASGDQPDRLPIWIGHLLNFSIGAE